MSRWIGTPNTFVPSGSRIDTRTPRSPRMLRHKPLRHRRRADEVPGNRPSMRRTQQERRCRFGRRRHHLGRGASGEPHQDGPTGSPTKRPHATDQMLRPISVDGSAHGVARDTHHAGDRLDRHLLGRCSRRISAQSSTPSTLFLPARRRSQGPRRGLGFRASLGGQNWAVVDTAEEAQAPPARPR